MPEKVRGLLDSARAKLTGLLGDFPAGFNSGAAAGFPGWAGDMAYMADTARLALTGADQQAAPENYVGTTEYIAKQAGFPVPQTLSGQLGAAVGGLMSPGPGDLAKFAPLGAMFLGAKAKTAMPDVLEYAQAMEKAGKSADEIWQTTGKLGQPWFRGADGKWRFEVDDSARFKSEPAKAALADTASGDVIPLSQLLGQEDEIARAYPDIGNVLFERTDAGGGLYYPPNKFGTEKIEVGSRDARSTALHETMHPIQVREGFALGGLPANSSKSAEDDYWRLAAEAEARNVQHRADMSMDERIALPPWTTQDVPTEQQIVRFGDGPAMAIEDFAARRAGKAKPYKESLPMDEASRMQRATEAGFNPNETLYHGGASDITEVQSGNRGFWLSPDPSIADIYAGNAEKRWPGQNNASPNVTPVMVRGERLIVSDMKDGNSGWYSDNLASALGIDAGPPAGRAKRLREEAIKQGYSAIEIRDMSDLGPERQTQVVVLDPSAVRSKFAAFDPSKKDSANLLAGAAATALGLGLAKQQLSEQERRNGM